MATTNKAFRVKNGLTVEGAELRPAIGTSTYPPILLTSGTNLTTATAGSFEYDGTRFYLTPASTRQAIALTDATGATLVSTITGSSLTSVGTLANLTVTNTITGSINGNAATVTNGVYTTGTYSNPSWITGLAWSKISTTPTTLSGYGITDAASSTHTHGNITNAGAIGSTANLVVVTTTSGAVTVATSTNQSSSTFLRGDLTWVTPTDTYPTTFSWTAGTTAGPTGALTGSMSTVNYAAIPSAGTGASGIITTAAQNIDGVKTFSSIPMVTSTAGASSNGLPTQALELVTKQYVDNVASGINAHDAVVAATTAALTATYNNNTTGVGATLTNSGTQAALVIDNVSLNSGDRVLVKNQGTTLQNGIYTVTTVGTVSTNWVLTRATDYDQSTAGEVQSGDTTFVVAPAAQFSVTPTNQNTGWTMNSPGTITIGTSAITFVQSSGSGTVTAGTGISVTGNQVSVDSSVLTTTSTQTGITNKTFVAPVLGAATATTINKVTLTAPASGSTLTIADGKTLTANNTLTLSGTDGSTLNIGGGGTLGTGAYATIANYVPTSTTVWGQALSGNITNAPLTGVTTITGNTTLGLLAASNASTGYALSITGGASTGTTGQTAGAVTITGGASTSGTSTNTGGAVTITGGAANTTAGIGGGVTINAGQGLSTTNGAISIGTTNTDSVTIGAVNQIPTSGTGGIILAGAGVISLSSTTTGTTAKTFSSIYSTGNYTSGEFIVKASNGTNIEVTKILVVTDGTNVYVTNYGDVYVSASLVTVDFTYSTSFVNMVVTPVAGTTGTTTIKVYGTVI